MRDTSENKVQKNHLQLVWKWKLSGGELPDLVIFIPYKKSNSWNSKTLLETWKHISNQIKQQIRISKISEITWSQLTCLLNSKENLINSRTISIHIEIVSIVTISI